MCSLACRWASRVLDGCTVWEHSLGCVLLAGEGVRWSLEVAHILWPFPTQTCGQHGTLFFSRKKKKRHHYCSLCKGHKAYIPQMWISMFLWLHPCINQVGYSIFLLTVVAILKVFVSFFLGSIIYSYYNWPNTMCQRYKMSPLLLNFGLILGASMSL